MNWSCACLLQEEALEREVQHLRGEIVGAEERETLHLAQYVNNFFGGHHVKRRGSSTIFFNAIL